MFKIDDNIIIVSVSGVVYQARLQYTNILYYNTLSGSEEDHGHRNIITNIIFGDDTLFFFKPVKSGLIQ